MVDINTFQREIISLVQKFEKDKHHYLSKDYLEAQVRQDFINPMFEAMGWATPTAKYNWRTQPALNAAIDFTE